MMLPIIAILFMVLVAIGAGGLLCSRLSVEAREQAWQGRDATMSLDPLPLVVGERSLEIAAMTQLFYTTNPPQSAYKFNSGRRQGLSTGSLPTDLVGVFGGSALGDANRQHTTFSGAWDHRELPFDAPNLEDPHRQPLELEPRLQVFGLTEDQLNIFVKLVPAK